jgi:hypothetical protein
MSGTLDGRAVENDAKRVGAQFERATDVTIDGASHDFWFLRPPLGCRRSPTRFSAESAG